VQLYAHGAFTLLPDRLPQMGRTPIWEHFGNSRFGVPPPEAPALADVTGRLGDTPSCVACCHRPLRAGRHCQRGGIS